MTEKVEQVKFGQGGVQLSTIQDVAEKKRILEEQRRKSLLREQIIFFVLSLIGVSPIVAAFFIQGNEEQSYMLFKVGLFSFLGLYPSYLIIRTIFGLVVKKKEKR